ncbi:rhamnan synthesis F family protein [Enterococcus gallinarum]|uniref:rhamnan synthesis F family protein n=1 Tax=Enterococcus gallinarum TaxID=1353 RepID=UPI0012E2D5A9|nr:rhamnan synthesis F family protein [Enterococcus gallinarum]MUN89869.1 glycosyltransferase [Enterococcus gallinarum]
MVLVSVIVTCYNHEKYIEQCLNSVLSQTYSNIELLIINDGSTDNSETKIKNTLKNAQIKYEYIYQENSGVCVTRNRGLEWMKGDYVLFIDSDNYLDLDYIEKMVLVAEQDGADIIYTDLINAATQEVFKKAIPFELKSYLSNNFIDNCSLIRASKINGVRYDINLNRKKLVDYDFIMNLILVNKAKPQKCNNTKLNYRVLSDSISRSGDHGTDRYYYDVYFYILKKHVTSYPKEIFNAAYKNAMILEGRLNDLTQHLADLTKHVNNQNSMINTLETEKEILNAEKVKLNSEKTKIEDELIQVQQNSEKELATLNQIIQTLENEKWEIIHSKSYRFGNFFIKPFSYFLRGVKNPSLILKAAKRIMRHVKKQYSKIVTPKTLFFKVKRSVQRKKNNYLSPSRMLIYVIYEDQEFLQQYKLLFLKELKKFCTDTLIVVNGNLPQTDIDELQKIGRVEVRKNVGYDTAAFRHGILLLGKEKLAQYDELLLVNDTNIGPIYDLQPFFQKMASRELDFWGISYGEEYTDFTSLNKYGYIPLHLQSYFLVIEKSLLSYHGFYSYWQDLNDTNSRDKAIGMHETVFTKHFSDLGFKHGAFTDKNEDSAMYIHPLEMLKEGVPIIKYAALSNYTDEKFVWQGLSRKTEIPELINFIKEKTDYPSEIIVQSIEEIKKADAEKYILVIDGVENVIPQLTKYRVENKIEQLKNLNFRVKLVGLSKLKLSDAERASHIIIYRAPYNELLVSMVKLAKEYHKPVLYDIDDLVIDTKYTDQLSYVQGLSRIDKQNYDAGVINYGRMLSLCDLAIASTDDLKRELKNYKPQVILNRNLANQELLTVCEAVSKISDDQFVHIGYFSGSITHNENFEMILPAVLNILEKYKQTKLHLVGHLDIPKELAAFENQIITHPFVDWRELPQLVKNVDINLAPLVDSVFNRAKSEIKWLEAALLKVPTIASDIGSFKDMIIDEETGILVESKDLWFEKLELLVTNKELRELISNNAFNYVMKHCTTLHHNDELTEYLSKTNFY